MLYSLRNIDSQVWTGSKRWFKMDFKKLFFEQITVFNHKRVFGLVTA